LWQQKANIPLAIGPYGPYFPSMSYFSRFNPLVAFADLRDFIRQRQRHELIFAVLSVCVTGGILLDFAIDAMHLEKPYVPVEVNYVKQWPANRTLAQVRAQQKIDAAQAKIDKAKKDEAEKARRAEFQKIDEAMNRMGL
jgi:hypothetical protein